MSRSRDCVSTRPSCTEVGRKVKPWRKKERAYQPNMPRSERGHLREYARAAVPCSRRGDLWQGRRSRAGRCPEHRRDGSRRPAVGIFCSAGSCPPVARPPACRRGLGTMSCETPERHLPSRPLGTARQVELPCPGFGPSSTDGAPMSNARRSRSTRSRLSRHLPERFSARSGSGFRWSAARHSRYRRPRAARLRLRC